MRRTILVPTTGLASDVAVFATALKIARQTDGHLMFLHLVADAAKLLADASSDLAGRREFDLRLDVLREELTRRAEAAHRLVGRFCSEEGLPLNPDTIWPLPLSASWRCEFGTPRDWLVAYGRTSDLIVMGRPDGISGSRSQSLRTALLDTGRPLVLAGTIPNLDNIAIAWKSTTEASRAVALTAFLLDKAKQITILTAPELGEADRESGVRLLATLRRNGLVAELRSLPRKADDVAATLIEAAIEVGAGLLVMGGYGHSRLREMIFGGVTKAILEDAPISVLMAH